jgi:ATPase components of ABC transporters with duplicated ATPase domains
VIALEARELSVEVGGRIVVEGLSIDLRDGDKVGVVGRNGAGKTTTLRVLAGEIPPAAGSVTRRGAVGYLRQDPAAAPRRGRGSRARAHPRGARTRRPQPPSREARIALEESHGEREVHRFARLGGGVPATRRLSGRVAREGDRRGTGSARGPALPSGSCAVWWGTARLELGRILFGGSDLLLLDEPTNHLDIDAKTWLMKFLTSYKGALVVVSHDLSLLDASITRILHLDRDGVVEYRGTYREYREARRLDEVRLGKLADRQQHEIQRLKTLADSMRGQTAKRARKAKTLDTRVSKLEAKRVEGPAKDKRVRFRFPDPPHSGRTVLVADGLTKSYGGPAIFEDVSFDLGRGERLLVLGLNGAGKTSLLRILMGETGADAGTFAFGHGVVPGYYAQEHEGVHDGVTVLHHMKEASDADDLALRTLLGMFGLHGEVAFQDAGTLSGGEKTKLALAILVAGRKNLLLLDEPTNNLDPPSRTAIAEALQGWPGAMLLVSHDQEFVEALARSGSS